MGVWGSCGSIGNVLGAYITSLLISWGLHWQASFQLLGLLNLIQIGLNFVFLWEPRQLEIHIDTKRSSEFLIRKENTAISFSEAIKTRGVLNVGASYFGLKFCYYGLMMWMPLYLLTNQQAISNYDVSWFVVVFEVGTSLGGFIFGVVTDFMGGRRYPLLVLAILVGAVFTY